MSLKSLKVYSPLVAIVVVIGIITLLRQMIYGLNVEAMMYDCMGITLLVFGTIKLLRWQGFVDAFRSYDLVAQRSELYAKMYPLIEIALGFLYLQRILPLFTNVTTLVLTSLSTISVVRELRKPNPMPCACMGAVFVLPMTWVTLAENGFMMAVAIVLLIKG